MIPNIACGGIGGAAPPLIALAIDLAYRDSDAPDGSFWFGALLFFFVGAAVVYAFGETVTRKAFFIGLGLPALVHGSIQDATSIPRSGLQSSLFLKPAYGAMLTSGDQKVLLAANPEIDQPYNVEILTKDGSPIGSVHVAQPGEVNVITLPEGSAYLRLQSPFTESVNIPLTERSTGNMGLKVGLQETPWSGFRRALGFRNVKPYEFSITVDKDLPKEWEGFVARDPSGVERAFSIDTFREELM